jgi:hypothetical protein
MKILHEEPLDAKGRAALPDSDFAIPKERKYPIPDEDHARNAISRVSVSGTDAEKKQVRTAVKRRFPDIQVLGVTT